MMLIDINDKVYLTIKLINKQLYNNPKNWKKQFLNNLDPAKIRRLSKKQICKTTQLVSLIGLK